MNPIQLKPIDVVVQQERKESISSVTYVTTDDPFSRRLQIVVNRRIVIIVQGDDYDTLGQWNDEAIKSIILKHLNATEAV